MFRFPLCAVLSPEQDVMLKDGILLIFDSIENAQTFVALTKAPGMKIGVSVNATELLDNLALVRPQIKQVWLGERAISQSPPRIEFVQRFSRDQFFELLERQSAAERQADLN